MGSIVLFLVLNFAASRPEQSQGELQGEGGGCGFQQLFVARQEVPREALGLQNVQGDEKTPFQNGLMEISDQKIQNQPHCLIQICSQIEINMLPSQVPYVYSCPEASFHYAHYQPSFWLPQSDLIRPLIIYPQFESLWPLGAISCPTTALEENKSPNESPTQFLQRNLNEKQQIYSKNSRSILGSGKLRQTFKSQNEGQQSQENSWKEQKAQKKKTKFSSGRKKTETKNLIKNYGRAMLTFMLKAKSLRKKLLAKLEIKENEFLDVIYEFRDQIHTISAIRYLWQSHPFSKAFRILSCEYLRKYNLQHIFNSRVVKFDIYLRYQGKIRRSMENPAEFQSLKDH